MKRLIKVLEKITLKLDGFLFKEISVSDNVIYFFTFHSIHKKKDEKFLSMYMDPNSSILDSDFILLINELKKLKFDFIGEDSLKNLSKISKKNICITFDDGYYNNMLLIEITEKLSIPVIIFTSSYFIEKNQLFWWDIFYSKRISDFNFLKKYKTSFELIDLSQNLFDTKMYSDLNKPLSILNLKELSLCKYISIGNHTHHHVIDNSINSNFFINDFILCQNKLKKWLGKEPTSFAFPNGETIFKKNTLLDIKNHGIENIFIVRPKPFKINFMNKNYYPRFMVNNRSSKFINHYNSILKNRFYCSFLDFKYQVKNIRWKRT